MIKDNFSLKNILKTVAIATLIFILFTTTNVISTGINAIEPIIIAFCIAYLLEYSVKLFMNKFKLGRKRSIFLTILMFIFILTVLGVLIVPRIVDAAISIFNSVMNMNLDFSFFENFNTSNPFLKEIQIYVTSMISPIVNQATDIVGSAISATLGSIQFLTGKLFSFITAFVTAFIISIYMLAEKNDLTSRLKRLLYAFLPSGNVDRILYIFSKADNIFKAFVIGKAIDSFIVGSICGVILFFMGIEYTLLIAIIIGITNMIPYFGPFLGAIPALLITFIGAPTEPILMLWVLIVILVLQQLDGWIIGPKILGDSTGVSPFWIVTAVIMGGVVFGLVGMFLGVPVLILAKTLIEESVDNKLSEKGMDNYEIEHLKKDKGKKF